MWEKERACIDWSMGLVTLRASALYLSDLQDYWSRAGGLAAVVVACSSLTADGPQRARSPFLPTATLPSCLWSLTRRRYGWLRMMVFPGAHLFRAPIWCPSGGWRHARGREHCRGEPGSSLSGGYAPDSAKAEDSSTVDEPGEG